MNSEEESSIHSTPQPKPRKLPRPALIKPKPHQNAAKPKPNQISSPEIQSITNSDTSDRTSIEMDVFLARAKTRRPKYPKFITSDVSEISNVNTISDDLITETSDDDKRHTEKSTNASDNPRSYRDKLKERFHSVKQKSSQSLEKHSLKQFRNKSEDIISLNKCIERLRCDNQNINQLLKDHNRYEYIGEGGLEVSSAEKYQFFCESLPEKLITTSQEKTEIADNEDGDKQPHAGQLNDHDQEENEDYVLVVDRRADNVKDLLVESYEEHVWVPKNKNLIFEAESKSRNIQDEGIFITKPPKMIQNHLYQLRQRLLASENKNWFDCSGNIQFDESNYSGFSYRPDGFDSEENPFDIVYQKASLTMPANLTEITTPKTTPTLEINIQGLRFTQHPLFSPEHHLQETLIHHFDKHKEFHRTQRREKLSDRLQTLRKTKRDLIDMQQAAGDNIREDSGFLIKQISNIREEYYNECREYRENVKNVLNAWKALKQLRQENGYSNTIIKLVINKQEKKFSDDLKQVYEEFMSEKEEEYMNKLKIYKAELLKWKILSQEADAIEEEKPLKPPRIISAKKLRSQVEGILKEVFGSDDEPALSFSVNYSHGVTTIDELSNEEEKQRRLSVGSKKLYLKLYYEGLSICKSKSSELNTNFTLNWDECLSLKLKVPDNRVENLLTVQLVEQQGLSKNYLCGIDILIPKETQIIGQSSFTEVKFDKEIDQNKPNKLSRISGFLTYCMGWNATHEAKLPSQENNISRELLNPDGTLDIEKLETWIETNNPDPEDPRNSIIFDYLKDKQEETSSHRKNIKYFRCDPYLEPFTICGKQPIEDNIRLQLLQLRDRNEPEFIGMVVPNRLKEIPTNIFSTYKRRLAEEKYQDYFDEKDAIDDDVVTKRSLGRKYLRQIHTKVFQICRNCENNLSFEDVVNEKMIAWLQNYLKRSLSNFLNWFKFQPAMHKPLPLLVPSNGDEECSSWNNISAKLIIQLKRGLHLPQPELNSENKSNSSRRASGKSRTTSAQSNISGIRSGKYYVEAIYEDVKISSSLTSGNDAIWNETLSIPLQSANIDYLNPHSLIGSININLYQQFEDDKNSTIDAYLGGVEVPLSATVFEFKLEGHFVLKVPPFIFGYEKEEETRTPSTPRVQHNKSSSYLEMSIYTESTIPKITADLSSITSNEPPFLKDHIFEWNKHFNADHPKRQFSALAIDSNGKTICATRFIKKLEPPQLNSDGFDVTLEQCARFVSLIPFSNANKFYDNVWLSAEQTLKLGIGSLTDHATLLTCYLLSLNLEVWLLLGFGIPHGHSAYVLIREYNDTPLPDHYIIDVTNGLKCNVTDPHCPLQRIYCIINDTNIWGNTQRGDAVFTTRFDFTRRFDWQALFNNTVSAPSNSMQQKLHYISNNNALKLQNAIEKKLIKKIMKVRTHDATIWNHYMSNLLKAQINKAEKNLMHGRTHIAMTNTISEFTNNYKINGTVQCLAFSSINDVVDKVLQTKIFLHVGRHIEFGTSVQVHAYNNQVIAVWIAFVSVMKEIQ